MHKFTQSLAHKAGNHHVVLYTCVPSGPGVNVNRKLTKRDEAGKRMGGTTVREHE